MGDFQVCSCEYSCFRTYQKITDSHTLANGEIQSDTRVGQVPAQKERQDEFKFFGLIPGSFLASKEFGYLPIQCTFTTFSIYTHYNQNDHQGPGIVSV